MSLCLEKEVLVSSWELTLSNKSLKGPCEAEPLSGDGLEIGPSTHFVVL